MTRFWVLLVVLLISMHHTEGNRGRGRHGYRGGMGYPQKNDYEIVPRKVSPRCSSERTWIRIVVEDAKGDGISNALVSIQDKEQMGKLSTDQNGIVKTLVKGCQISLIVWGKHLQSTYKLVNLEKNRSGKESIYVEVKSSCNFVIFFDQRSDGPDSTVGSFNDETGVQYQYVAKSGSNEVTGTGYVVVGRKNPVCINWDPITGRNTGSLKVQAVAQSSAETSILYITNQGAAAVVNIPPYIDDFYKFLICLNVWEADDPNDLIDVDEDVSGFLKAFDDYGSISLYNSLDEDGCCAWFKNLDDLTFGENTLLAIQFADYYGEEADDEELEGNASIFDCNGKYVTVELPKDNTYHEPELWPIACICAGATDISGIKVLKNQDFSDSIYDNSLCDDVCTQNSK